MVQLRDHHDWSQSEEAILVIGFQNGVGLVELSSRHLRSLSLIEEKLIEIGWIHDLANYEKLDYIEHDVLVNSEPFLNIEPYESTCYDGPNIESDEVSNEADEDDEGYTYIAKFVPGIHNEDEENKFLVNVDVVLEFLERKYDFETSSVTFSDFDNYLKTKKIAVYSNTEYALKFYYYVVKKTDKIYYGDLKWSEFEDLGELLPIGEYGWCLVGLDENVEAGPFTTLVRAERAYEAKYLYYEDDTRGEDVSIQWGKVEECRLDSYR